MNDFHQCDLCNLNRATLHIDEVHDGDLQGSAHLCDDCWYRLGIRIPLGNIWNHIRRIRDQGLMDPGVNPTNPDELTMETDEFEEGDLDELLDPGSLAVAEPDEEVEDEDLFGDVEDALSASSEGANRQDNLNLENMIDRLDKEEDTHEENQPLGIQAVRIGRIHPTLVSLFPIPMLKKHKAIPIKMEESRVTVALADPFDVLSKTNIEVYLEHMGLGFVQAIASETEILAELERHANPPGDMDLLS
ncbi:MAG: hypothetical protein KC917_06360 [Candidatus Omnitrophica bacterium]|nr:hypothetical protein [Candidatus Omnitrophota bacterium]